MRSPAHDIALYLEDEGVGTFAGESTWSINVSREPDSPDGAVTVYDTGGNAADPVNEIYEPTIQVRVRAEDYATAYSKHEEIRDILIIPTSVTLGAGDNTWYIGIWMQSDILSIGRDDHDRHILTANYRIQRQPLT